MSPSFGTTRKMIKKGYETIKTDEDDDNHSATHPASSANFLSLLTCWWMNSTFRTGNKRPLNQSDFLPLNEEDRTRDQTERLQELWDFEVQRCSTNADRKPKLWKCFLRMLSCKEILFLLSFWFLESIFLVSVPLVLGLLLSSLNSAEIDRPLVYGCCLIIGMTGVFAATTHYAEFRCDLLGMRLSSALKGIIYRKILLVTQQSLLKTTTGKVMDLISNDVQRMETAPTGICVCFFSFSDIIVVSVLVYYLIGWQGLMGILFSTMLLPCVLFISSVCARLHLEISKVSDRRISLMNELVTGIRALKTHAWEEYYEKKVMDVRSSELWIILKKSALLSLVQGGEQSSASLSAFLSIVTLVLTGQYVSTSKAFMLLALLNVLIKMIVNRMGHAAPGVFEVFASFERIERFLLRENVSRLDSAEYTENFCSEEKAQVKSPVEEQKEHLTIENGIVENHNGVPGKRDSKLSVSGLSCKLDNSSEKFLLRDISFVARENSLTVVTGPVGGGKSTLLATIAGEVTKTSGEIFCQGTIAYVPQSAWVFPGTIRENILFGEPFEAQRYADVLKACSLAEDISRFPQGDLTYVGERGVVFSGGQRARVSLARAVYADADVYILDDPLSAVDIKVGEHIFEECICKLLGNKIKILVTYAETCLKAGDQVVVLHKGFVAGKGTFQELQEDEKILDIIKDVSANNKRIKKVSPGKVKEKVMPTMCSKDAALTSGGFGENLEISEEEMATGSISFSLYWNYIRAGMHPVAIICLLLFFLVTQVVLVAPNIWLAILTRMTKEKQQDATTIQIYGILVAAAFGLGIVRAFLLFHVLLRSAQALHNRMVTCLLRTLVLFFDTNPAGRILNRSSKDMGCIDELLPTTFLAVAQYFMMFITAVILPSVINGWFVFVTLPLIAAFVYLTWYYLNTSRELKRLESICRSPVFSHFSETMEGLSTIRTRKKEKGFLTRFYRHQDLHNEAFYMVKASSFWLAVRADLLCSVLITAVAFAFVLLSQDPALTGLVLVYTINTAKMCQFAVRQFGDVENAMTSVERIMAYTKLDTEPGYKIKALPPENWPSAGHVSFRDVSLRYYPGGPKVLKNLSFEIQEKQKLGIVGRTGDGKSSIVAALLRMPEADGEIVIDGVSVKTIQLQESRKSVSVLSQSPVLLSGTLRKNLDPLEKHRDDELWNVLEEVKMKKLVENLEGQLNYELLERGENLSVGERQLICLARTLLQQNKIVILDEPTASVDPKTEQTIWTTVREKLRNSTVIIIAHRLNTVKDCDEILVMKEGQVAEMDSLDVLLSREGGIFHNMAASQDLLS